MRSLLAKYAPLLSVFIPILLLPEMAVAQTPTPSAAEILCEVYGYIHGPVGSVIAMLGVISLGLIAMFGKIQLSSVLTIMAGIALIFGAPEILRDLGIFQGVTNACTSGAANAATIMGSEVYIALACIVSWFVGPIGKALASLSIIVLGLFATFGRISWHQAVVVAVGMAAMFGSVSIIQALGVPMPGGNITFVNVCALGGGGVISFEAIFCNLLFWFNGPIAKGIATTGIIVVGLGALFGKVSWPMSIVVVLGAALMFGSEGIVDAVGGASVQNC